MALTHAPAVQHHLVAGLPVAMVGTADGADQIDAGHHREFAHHRRGTGDRQAILVVQGRIIDVDGHIALGQLRLIDLGERHALLVVGLFDQDGGKHAVGPS